GAGGGQCSFYTGRRNGGCFPCVSRPYAAPPHSFKHRRAALRVRLVSPDYPCPASRHATTAVAGKLLRAASDSHFPVLRTRLRAILQSELNAAESSARAAAGPSSTCRSGAAAP